MAVTANSSSKSQSQTYHLLKSMASPQLLQSAKPTPQSAALVTNSSHKVLYFQDLEVSHFSKDKINATPTPLGQCMQQPNPSSTEANVSIMCHQGSTSHTFTATSNKGTWIVDSRASDHMTGDLQVFSTFKPCVESNS